MYKKPERKKPGKTQTAKNKEAVFLQPLSSCFGFIVCRFFSFSERKRGFFYRFIQQQYHLRQYGKNENDEPVDADLSLFSQVYSPSEFLPLRSAAKNVKSE